MSQQAATDVAEQQPDAATVSHNDVAVPAPVRADQKTNMSLGQSGPLANSSVDHLAGSIRPAFVGGSTFHQWAFAAEQPSNAATVSHNDVAVPVPVRADQKNNAPFGQSGPLANSSIDHLDPFRQWAFIAFLLWSNASNALSRMLRAVKSLNSSATSNTARVSFLAGVWNIKFHDMDEVELAMCSGQGGANLTEANTESIRRGICGPPAIKHLCEAKGSDPRPPLDCLDCPEAKYYIEEHTGYCKWETEFPKLPKSNAPVAFVPGVCCGCKKCNSFYGIECHPVPSFNKEEWTMNGPDAENPMGTLLYKGGKASCSDWVIYTQGINSKGGQANQSSRPNGRKDID